MTSRIHRRIRSLVVLIVAVIVAVLIDQIIIAAHLHSGYLSGCVLMGIVLVLAAYGLRKSDLCLGLSDRLIGSSSKWLQVHIYLGLFSSGLYVIHTRFAIPNGFVERILAGLYLTTFLSGVFGLCISRWFPKRLANRREEILFERIAGFRLQLSGEIRELISEADDSSTGSGLPELYALHLRDFFACPRNVFWHLIDSHRPLAQLCSHVADYRTYLSQGEIPKLERVLELIRVKNELDNHFALQGTLKLWLFLHIPLAWGLVVFGLFHGLLVLAFT